MMEISTPMEKLPKKIRVIATWMPSTFPSGKEIAFDFFDDWINEL